MNIGPTGDTLFWNAISSVSCSCLVYRDAVRQGLLQITLDIFDAMAGLHLNHAEFDVGEFSLGQDVSRKKLQKTTVAHD